MNDNDLYDKIKKQIEYYLCDDNLKNDPFFNSLISSSPDGFVSLQVFMNCNKIKKMNIKMSELPSSRQLLSEPKK